jgi:ribosomal protein S18 acetylase RimI-like enzyme
MTASAVLEFEPFSLERDRKLYFEGYVEAYQESFPGVSIPSAVRMGLAASVEDMGRADSSHIAMTALLGQAPVGFVVVGMGTFLVVPMARIEALYVAPEFRRRGFARDLLAQAAAWCRYNGGRFIRLDVTASNEAALTLYESQGYVVTRYQMDAVVA